MNHIKYEKKIRKLSISILFFLPVLIFICDSCGCYNNNTSSKAKTTKNTVSNKNSNTTDHKPEKGYKELQNNKEKGEKEKGEEERKRQEEEEREKRGKEIQDQIARLEDLINYNDLPSKETIIEIFTLKDNKDNNITLKDKDYTAYFSPLLDFTYEESINSLIKAKPTDLKQAKEIEIWIEKGTILLISLRHT